MKTEAKAHPARPTKDSTPKEIEEALGVLIENHPALTFGYIGNFERWGDDRSLRIWVKGLWEKNGNQTGIWAADAVRLTFDDFVRANRAVHYFAIGFKAATAAFKTATTPAI